MLPSSARGCTSRCLFCNRGDMHMPCICTEELKGEPSTHARYSIVCETCDCVYDFDYYVKAKNMNLLATRNRVMKESICVDCGPSLDPTRDTYLSDNMIWWLRTNIYYPLLFMIYDFRL